MDGWNLEGRLEGRRDGWNGRRRVGWRRCRRKRVKLCFLKSTKDKQTIAVTDPARWRHDVHLAVGIQIAPPSPLPPPHPHHPYPLRSHTTQLLILLLFMLLHLVLLLLLTFKPSARIYSSFSHAVRPHAMRNPLFLFMLQSSSFSSFSVFYFSFSSCSL